MESQEQIKIQSLQQELIKTLLTTLVENPTSSFRQQWADLLRNNGDKQKVLNFDQYPTLSSLLNSLSFSSKRALFQCLFRELQEKEITSAEKLIRFLRELRAPQIQERIRIIYNLPYFVDLDFLKVLMMQVRTGSISLEDFLKLLGENGQVSNKRIKEELEQKTERKITHFPKDRRAEITRQYQSPEPLKQSIAEAVSNSIDAILTKQGIERSIGQWGRGIKMLTAYLDHPQDSIVVTTTKDNQTWQIEIKKGGDGRFYLRSEKIDQPKEEQEATGTTVTLQKQPLDEDFLELLKINLKTRFRFTPDVEIKINDEPINDYANLINLSTNKPLKREKTLGNVDISLKPNQVSIKDNGSGMTPDQLLSMFIPNLGSKPFIEITQDNRHLFLPLVEVFYEETRPEKEEACIYFSRNREVIFSIRFDDKLNLFNQPLFFELGPLLESSDARLQIKINDNFKEAIKKTIDLVVEGETESLTKVQVLNTLTVYLLKSGGEKLGDKRQQTFFITQDIITYCQEKIAPLIEDLTHKGYRFIPNNPEFSYLKISTDPKTIFLDSHLFYFKPQKIPDFEQIPPSIFQSSTGKKLFLADFKEEAPSPIIAYENGFFIDKKVWQKLLDLKEKSPQDFKVLLTALNLRLNPVSTSYDPYEEPLKNLQNIIVFKDQIQEESESQETKLPLWLTSEQKEKIKNTFEGIKEIADYGNSVNSVSFSPDGQKIVYAGKSGKVYLYDLQTQELKLIANYRNRRWVNSVSFSPDGQKIVCADIGGTVYLYDFQTKESKSIANCGSSVNSVSFSPDGQKIVYAGSGGTVYLYDLQTQESKLIADYRSGVNSVSFSPDGQKIVYTGEGGTVYLYDLQTQESKLIANYRSWVISVSFSPDGQKIVCAVIGGTVYLYDFQTKESKSIANCGSSVNSVSFSPDGQKIVYADTDGTVYLYDLQTQESKSIADYRSWVNSVSFSPDGQKIVYAGKSGKVYEATVDYKINFTFSKASSLLEALNDLYSSPQTIVDAFCEFFVKEKNEINENLLTEIVKILKETETLKKLQQLTQQFPQISEWLNDEERTKTLNQIITNTLYAYFFAVKEKNFSSLLQEKIFDSSLFYFLDFSLINPNLDYDNLEQIINNFPISENLLKHQRYFYLINGFFAWEKDPQKRALFLEKLFKIKNNPNYQKYLESIQEYNQKKIQEFFSQRTIDKAIKGRALFEYLKKEGAIAIETASFESLDSEWGINDKNASLFARTQVPLTEIFYQYHIKGNRDWQAIVEKINQEASTPLNLETFRQELIKEVSGQAIEEGVAKREMIQNAVDAIKKRDDISEGRIDIKIRIAEKDGEEYLVEEFSDNGTGVLNWVKFFIPGETTKLKGDEGFFGSGAFKIFEGSDRVDILSSDGKNTFYFRFEWQNNNLVITESQIIPNHQGEKGTSIRRIKKIKEDTIKEIEAGIIVDDYVAFAGLIADETVEGKTIKISLNNEPLHLQKEKRLEEDFMEFGPIILVESSLPPTIAHGIGLRMSDLNKMYLEYVPEDLKQLLKDKKISIILPSSLPLIKDRSRIANEEYLLEPLKRKIAGMVIKLAAQELIQNFRQRIAQGVSKIIWKPKGFPDDWFINPQYSSLSPSDVKKIIEIIRKLNSGEILNYEELNILNQPFDVTSRLAMVIVRIKVPLKDGRQSNLLVEINKVKRTKKLRQIYRRKFDPQVRSSLSSSINGKIDLQGIYTTNGKIDLGIDTTLLQQPGSIDIDQGVGVANSFFGKRDEKDVNEQLLTEKQKKILDQLRKIAALFGLSVIPKKDIGANGYFHNKYFVVDISVLDKPLPYAAAIFLHELAHFGPIYNDLFTNQVSGVFGELYYWVLDQVLQQYPKMN